MTAAEKCATCGRDLGTEYYEVNGRITCEDCRILAEEEFNLGGRGRLLQASLVGLLGAAGGAGLYYAVSRFTGTHYAIVAAVVGLIVGAAVRYGSRGEGGWRYQTLAVFLTYAAIVASEAPSVLQRLQAHPPAGAPMAAAAPATQAVPGTDSTTAIAHAESRSAQLMDTVASLAVLLAFLSVAPVLASLDNAVGLIIIGVAILEAWYLTRRGRLRITGPHPIAPVA